QENGVPCPVQRTRMAPPRCRMGAITAEERAAVRGRSPIGGKYDTRVDRESAYEVLGKRAAEAAPQREAAQEKKPAPANDPLHDLLWGTGRRQGMVESMAKSAARTM